MAQKFAFRFYDPGQFCGPVTFFRASERASDKIGNEMEGWQKIIQNDLQIIDIPGDHHTVVEEPHIRDLAAKLGACIEQAQSAQGLTSA
jgi:thioesterase domain-containing protein